MASKKKLKQEDFEYFKDEGVTLRSNSDGTTDMTVNREAYEAYIKGGLPFEFMEPSKYRIVGIK